LPALKFTRRPGGGGRENRRVVGENYALERGFDENIDRTGRVGSHHTIAYHRPGEHLSPLLEWETQKRILSQHGLRLYYSGLSLRKYLAPTRAPQGDTQARVHPNKWDQHMFRHFSLSLFLQRAPSLTYPRAGTILGAHFLGQGVKVIQRSK
jgi:hypothetical protein